MARYEGYSHQNQKIPGGFACIKTLADEIAKTHATAKRMIARLRERGFLVDLGPLFPGGPMRRRVSITEEHMEAFCAKRQVDKNTRQLLQNYTHKESPANSALHREEVTNFNDDLPVDAAPETPWIELGQKEQAVCSQ